MKILPVLCLLSLFSSMAYCQKARISCPPKTNLKKDVSLGYLNFRGARIGEIYVLKLRNNKIVDMQPLAHLTVPSSNVDTSERTILKEHDTQIDFTLDVTADVSPAYAAELKKKLGREMRFSLFNTRSIMIKEPQIQLANYDPSFYPLKAKQVYAIINRVIVADSLVVKTKTGLDIKGSATVQLSDYSVQVINDCEGLLRIVGEEVPVFFEFLAFTPVMKTSTVQQWGNKDNKTIKLKQIEKWEEIKGLEFEDDLDQ